MENEKISEEQDRYLLMETSCFDAAVKFKSPITESPLRVRLCRKGAEIPASFYLYQEERVRMDKPAIVQVHSSKPLSLKWKDAFAYKGPEGGEVWGEGVVLDPAPERITPRRMKRRMRFLERLQGDEQQMLLAVAEYRGTQGVWEKDILNFSPLAHESILKHAIELESDGCIRILGFSPLFLISQKSFVFLSKQILGYLKRYHEHHPERIGAPKAKIQKRFDLHPRVLSLTLKSLNQDGQVVEKGDFVALSHFKMTLLPEEKKIVARLEDMLLKGEFHSVSLGELQKTLRLSAGRLQKIMLILVERQKIVFGKDGYILHSRWLDDIVSKVRKSGKKELTVSEFKDMTGLSRKYAIPLLELLDQMGITRRRGPNREIL